MKITKNLCYFFTNVFDLITIGTYANRVGNIVNNRMKNNFFNNLAI